jgi:hypothetical protein
MSQAKERITIRCNQCRHRGWQEGDREYCPPGYGIHYCGLVPEPGGALSEGEATGELDPPQSCSLRGDRTA